MHVEMGVSPFPVGVFSTLLTETPSSRTVYARIGGGGKRQLTDTLSFDDLTECDMFVVEVGGWHSGDEELRSVGVGTGIGHRQEERLVVLPGERLVCELFTVDRLSAGPVSGSEITTLNHEPVQRDFRIHKMIHLRGAALTYDLITRWKMLPA